MGKGYNSVIILFDLDGTLIDSTEAILESFHNSFDVHAHPHPSDDAIKRLIGHPLDVMYSRLGISEQMVWQFVTTYKEHYRVISTEKTHLLESAREAVLAADKIATLGIVTTKTGAYSQILMEHFGLMQYFEVLIGREHVQKPKPDAEPIERALRLLDKDDSDIWMIGDTQMDLISASNAGINSMGVLSGYDSKETLEKFTNVIFSDVFEAVKYLESRNISHT
jgi:phosphoglycolate phosphatase